MKNLKRLLLFAAGIIVAAKLIINYREKTIEKTRKEKKEHRFILGLLESNKDIKKLMELKEIKHLGVKFRKHPKPKKDSNKNKNWEARADNTITIPIYDNVLISPDKNIQLLYLAHELGHLNNKRNFKHYRPCNHKFQSCLLVEIQTDLYAAGLMKKIGVGLSGCLWSRNFGVIRDQCKDCLEIIRKGDCPTAMITKINKCLDALNRISKLESRRIIFQEE